VDTGVTTSDAARRAARLLRWYPASWRERYGEEFEDHLEQEFSDRSVDRRRTANIVYEGLVARVADVGLATTDVGLEGRTRASVGTSFALVTMMMVVMLDLWSRAIGLWNSFSRASVPDTVATGILTIATGLLLMVLVAVVLVVGFSVVRQVARGRARPLVGPSTFAVISGAFLLYSARWVPRELDAYIRGDGPHGGPGFPGIRLSHPGAVIKALAQITWELTQGWVAIWGQGGPRTPIGQTVMNDLAPLAVLVFGVAVAVLMRRVDLPRVAERLGSPTVVLLGALAGVFFLSYLAWSWVGGPSSAEYWFPESPWLGVAYLVLLALVAVLVGRAGMLALRSRSTRSAPPGDDDAIRISI
jgi:hypothetical protein